MNRTVLVVAICCAWPAQAQYYSGNKLHELCQFNRDIALGFVLGIADMEMAPLPGSDKHGKTVARQAVICIPDNAVSGQLVDIACKSIADRPEERHWPGYLLVFNALIKAFPCKAN